MHSAPDGLTPVFYKRFIDDLIIVWLHGDACLLRFFDYVNSIHPHWIRFTMEFGRSVHYMDSQLTIEENGQISSDLYVKPTDKRQYLLPTSNRPPHVHRHLPYGLAIRLRQIVSVDEIIMRLEELKSFLLAKGYQTTDIDRQFAKAIRVPRSVALQCKKKISEDRVPLVCEWNERLPNLGNIIHQYLPTPDSIEYVSICFKHPPFPGKQPQTAEPPGYTCT